MNGGGNMRTDFKAAAVSAAVLIGLFLSPAAVSQDAMPAGVHFKEVVTPDGPVNVLADADGMTLYIFDMDRPQGGSVCNNQCATYWPPLLAAEDAEDLGEWTVIARVDGSKMWAFRGRPLYTFAKDTSPADFSGNNVPQDSPVWHYVHAEGQ